MMNPFLSERIFKLEKFVSKYGSIEGLIENLYLKAIIEAYGWIRTNESIEGLSENKIRNRFIHNFKHENSILKEYIGNLTIVLTKENEAYTQDELKRTDFELISSDYQKKFVVECKRLGSVETRYVNGVHDKDGNYQPDGLEKFIKLLYSEGDEYAGMVGFIVEGNPHNIVVGLKTKAQNLYPSDDAAHLHDKRCIDWALSFQSKHIRKDGTTIHLYHLFCDFVGV